MENFNVGINDKMLILKRRQALSLQDKIALSKHRIKEWYEAFDGQVYVAFSGGKDSTVLLDLVRSLFPDVPAVFNNTGIEFPEITKFVRTVDNVTWLKPKKNFRSVIKDYGYPVVSKKMAQYIYEVRNAKGETATKHLRLTGFKSNGDYSQMSKIPDKWKYLINAPFNISERCCDVMKKRPSKKYSKDTGRMPFIGTMAYEGKNRERTYLRHGCNAYDLSSQPMSTPLAFWMEEDVWEYIKTFNLQYSSIYNMGYTRTGCVFCMFGVHLESEPNRFQRLHDTHPKLWNYCINKLDIGRVLHHIGVPAEDKQLKLFG